MRTAGPAQCHHPAPRRQDTSENGFFSSTRDIALQSSPGLATFAPPTAQYLRHDPPPVRRGGDRKSSRTLSVATGIGAPVLHRDRGLTLPATTPCLLHTSAPNSPTLGFANVIPTVIGVSLTCRNLGVDQGCHHAGLHRAVCANPRHGEQGAAGRRAPLHPFSSIRQAASHEPT